jgi:hypothetical protein
MAAAAAIELAAREQGALAASAAISPSSSLCGADVSVSATNTMTAVCEIWVPLRSVTAHYFVT